MPDEQNTQTLDPTSADDIDGAVVKALDAVTGQFFDGLSTARALPQAYDPQFRAELGEVTGQIQPAR